MGKDYRYSKEDAFDKEDEFYRCKGAAAELEKARQHKRKEQSALTRRMRKHETHEE